MNPQYLLLGLFALLLSGCDLQWGAPERLWTLWLIPLILTGWYLGQRRLRTSQEKFVSRAMTARILLQHDLGRERTRKVLWASALVLLIVALAQPRWGFVWEDVQREGVDIVVALDVSDSMLVTDGEDSGRLTRLERARREISDLINLLDGDRISLVAFAGDAFIECPLTLDYGAARLFVDALSPDLIPTKGTAIASAIETSIEAFESSNQSSRALILITDGEDHEGAIERAAEKAKEANIMIFAIGIGRAEGAPIPSADGSYRRDRAGKVILSRLDETSLEKIALKTGGRYVRSTSNDLDLEAVYAQGIKANLTSQELGSKRRQRWEERFQWLVALALLALALEAVLPNRRGQEENA